VLAATVSVPLVFRVIPAGKVPASVIIVLAAVPGTPFTSMLAPNIPGEKKLVVVVWAAFNEKQVGSKVYLGWLVMLLSIITVIVPTLLVKQGELKVYCKVYVPSGVLPSIVMVPSGLMVIPPPDGKVGIVPVCIMVISVVPVIIDAPFIVSFCRILVLVVWLVLESPKPYVSLFAVATKPAVGINLTLSM
jgi:hypothetical protein